MLTTSYPFGRLARIEARKLFGRLLVWMEVGILGFLVAILHVAIIATLEKGGGGQLPAAARAALRQMLYWPQALNNALVFANGGELGGMFVVVLVAAFMAQEYTWHTLHLWLSRGVPRARYLIAKFAAVLIALALLVIVALVAGATVTGVYTYVQQGSLPLNTVDLPLLLRNVVYMLITLLPYAALTFLLAVVSRSTMVTIGVGLGYTLVVENILVELLTLLSGRVAHVARYMPTLLAKSLAQAVAPSTQVQVGMQTPATISLLDPTRAALLLIAYTLVFMGLALWWFRRQDVTV